MTLAGGDAPEAAVALAKALPPSISGHGGDHALFSATNELATITGEDSAALLAVLRDVFNPRCVPPWDDAKLKREAERAAGRQASPEGRSARRRRGRANDDDDAPGGAFTPATGGGGSLALDVTRQGTPRPTLNNVALALDHVFADRIRYEECTGRILVADVDESLGYFPDGEWSDDHTSAALRVCEAMRLYVPPSVVDRAVSLHGKRYAYNVLADSLRGMAEAWDGEGRIDSALVDYWGAPDTAATRATSRVMFLSLAARGLSPGQKVDTCPVFIGTQGARKSSSLRALVGADFFSDSPLAIGEKDGAQAIQGKWLWEFGENSSLSRRERNQVKAFLSQQIDRYRASYGRHMHDVPRTCTFIASTNEDEFLNDPTGSRRFLPVRVAVTRRIDTAAIAGDRVQLLGEAAHRWLHGEAIDGQKNDHDGEPHWLSDAEERALDGVRDDATERDVWADLVEAWIAERSAPTFTMRELLDEHTGAIRLTDDRLDKRTQARVGGILRGLGCARVVEGGVRSWRGPEPPPHPANVSRR